MSKYDNRYIIFDITELDTLNFDQVLETSADTIVYNLAETKTVVKYVFGDMPSSVQALTTKEGPYSYTEIKNILTGSEWTNPNDDLD
jgi:hypothetical protein